MNTVIYIKEGKFVFRYANAYCKWDKLILQIYKVYNKNDVTADAEMVNTCLIIWSYILGTTNFVWLNTDSEKKKI